MEESYARPESPVLSPPDLAGNVEKDSQARQQPWKAFCDVRFGAYAGMTKENDGIACYFQKFKGVDGDELMDGDA